MRKTLHRKRAGKFGKILLPRIVMLLAVIALSATSGAMLHASAMNRDQGAESAAQSSPVKTDEIGSLLSVEAGDTLWSLAERYKPVHMGVKQYIRQIIAVNDLQTSQLYTGQVLRLP